MRIRAGIALAVLIVAGLTACGTSPGDGDGAAGGPSTAAGDPQDTGVKFAQCMREHGIPMEDPKPGEGIKLTVPQNISKEDVDAANAECKQYLPGGGDRPVPTAEEMEKLRAFSQCMRDNGVESFPDPGPDGGLMIDQGSGVDPESDEFKSAQEACRSLQPGPKQVTG